VPALDVGRLRSIRGAELKIDRWLQSHAPVETTSEKEAPWILVTRKSRTLLQPPSSITTKNNYEALITIDTQKQGLQEETTPAAQSGYRKKKWRILVVGDSLLRGTKAPIC